VLCRSLAKIRAVPIQHLNVNVSVTKFNVQQFKCGVYLQGVEIKCVAAKSIQCIKYVADKSVLNIECVADTSVLCKKLLAINRYSV